MDLTPVEEGPRFEPADDRIPPLGDDNDNGPRVQIAEVPCGRESHAGNMTTEFRFGQLAAGPNVSADRACGWSFAPMVLAI